MDSEFIAEVKDKILLELGERIGYSYYICDLGYDLTSAENTDGSWYYSTYKAKEAIKKYLDEYMLFVGYSRTNLDFIPYFESEPDDYHHGVESVHCAMMIEAVNDVFNLAVSNYEEQSGEEFDRDSKLEITDNFIEKIKKGLVDIDDAEDIW